MHTTTPDIHFTPKAIQRITHVLTTQPQAAALRLSVKSTGCSGLSYVLDYVTEGKPTDLHMPITEGYTLYVDHESYPYLKGLSIDYIKQGIHHKFTFHNPNQTGQCGCGESFTVQ